MADLTVSAEPIELTSDDGVTLQLGGTVTITGDLTGTPSGGAGGFLSGTYPNPGVNTEALQDAVGAMAGAGMTYDDTAGELNATQAASVDAPSDGTHTLVEPVDGVWPVVVVAPSASSSDDDTGRAHVVVDLTDPAAVVGSRVLVKIANQTAAAPYRLGASIGAKVDTPAVLGDFADLAPSTLNFASSPATYTIGGQTVVFDQDYADGAAAFTDMLSQLSGVEMRTSFRVGMWTEWASTSPDPLTPEVYTLCLVTTATGAAASLEVVAPPGDPFGLEALTHTPGYDGAIWWGVERNVFMAGHGQTHHTSDAGGALKGKEPHQAVELVVMEDDLGLYLGTAGEALRAEYMTVALNGDGVSPEATYLISEALQDHDERLVPLAGVGAADGDVLTWDETGGAYVPAAPTGGTGTVDVVSNVATSTILGRVTAGSGNSEELTAAQVRSLIGVPTIVFSQGAGTARTTTTPQSLLTSTPSLIHPGDGGMFRIDIGGLALNNSGASRAIPQLSVTLGASTVTLPVPTAFASSATARPFRLQGTIVCTGSSAQTGTLIQTTNGVAAVISQFDLTENLSGSGQTFDVLGRTATNDATQSVQVTHASIERVPAV